tara:strand:+ start:68 stop:370 length:303 start_codon:yes stop_codon:yes gene_type:complete
MKEKYKNITVKLSKKKAAPILRAVMGLSYQEFAATRETLTSMLDFSLENGDYENVKETFNSYITALDNHKNDIEEMNNSLDSQEVAVPKAKTKTKKKAKK